MHAVHGHGPSACEVCGGEMRKLLSAPAIVFKGSGWAKVDARAASKSRSPGKAATSGPAATTGGDAGNTLREGVVDTPKASDVTASSSGSGSDAD